MTVQTFEDLQIWKEARRLTQEIYRLTERRLSRRISA
jgi:hypothetical protein